MKRLPLLIIHYDIFRFSEFACICRSLNQYFSPSELFNLLYRILKELQYQAQPKSWNVCIFISKRIATWASWWYKSENDALTEEMSHLRVLLKPWTPLENKLFFMSHHTAYISSIKNSKIVVVEITAQLLEQQLFLV